MNSEEDKNSLLRKYLGIGYSTTLIGAFLFIIANITFAILPTVPIPEGEVWLLIKKIVNEITSKKDTINYLCLFLIGLGFILNGAGKLARTLWDESFAITFKTGFKDISDVILENLKPIKNTLEADKLDDLIKKSNKDEVLRSLKSCNSILYGNHCDSDRALINAVQRKFNKFYKKTISYRTDCHKSAIISVKDNDYCFWEEIHDYNVFCPAYSSDYRELSDKEIERCSYKIHHKSGGIVGKIDNVDELSEHSIVIEIDNKVIFDLKNQLEIETNGKLKSTHPDLIVNYDGQNLHLEINVNIEITKADTKVRILEKSVISTGDNLFIWATSVPFYSGTFNIKIPDKWDFQDVSQGDKSWQKPVRNQSSNDLYARIDGWVLPGIVFVAKWKKD